MQAVRGLKGRSVIDREISAGTWLEPVLWSSKCSRWQKSEVQALIDARVAGFDDGAMRVLVVTLRARRLALGARLKETSL